MKLYRLLFKGNKEKKTQNSKEESLMRFGREQFKALAKKGLSVPVVLL
jgi:hypothetical protein